METQIQLQVIFYRNQNGNEPVREWLWTLTPPCRKIIGEDIKTVQFGWPLGMPVVSSLGEGLWEVRSNLEGGISRIIFALHDHYMILLHGFIKKTQKTPLHELELAKKRLKELRRGL
ncbi:type II toxin-antitoxin system RelE/ParE family toxin [Deltaproteobacteria bacterium TL4]